MDTVAHPWDQRPDEPPEAYARFLTYRNLGPGRSLALANNVHVGAAKRRKSPNPSGQWQDDSVEYDWIKRAIAWDVHHLKDQGHELARMWMAVLLSAVTKAAQRLADPDCQPKDFTQALAVVDKLSPYLTPDVVHQALQPAAHALRSRIRDTGRGGVE